jgi:hypothetical protein
LNVELLTFVELGGQHFASLRPSVASLQNLTGLESAIRYDGPDDGLITRGPPRQRATARSDWIPEWVGNDGIFRE